jgi:hypothetical protein
MTKNISWEGMMIQIYGAAEIKVLNSAALTSALNQIAQNFDRLWPYRPTPESAC